MLYNNKWAMLSPSVCLVWLFPPQANQLEVSVKHFRNNEWAGGNIWNEGRVRWSCTQEADRLSELVRFALQTDKEHLQIALEGVN